MFMTEKKKQKKAQILTAAITLLVLIGALFLLSSSMKPKTSQGSKEVTVEVVHKDGTSKEFVYHTDKEYLGEVITEEKLVEGEEGQYGLFITAADGESVEGTDWWCITKDGEMLNTSADQTPIEDGEHYELTYTAG